MQIRFARFGSNFACMCPPGSPGSARLEHKNTQKTQKKQEITKLENHNSATSKRSAVRDPTQNRIQKPIRLDMSLFFPRYSGFKGTCRKKQKRKMEINKLEKS